MTLEGVLYEMCHVRCIMWNECCMMRSMWNISCMVYESGISHVTFMIYHSWCIRARYIMWHSSCIIYAWCIMYERGIHVIYYMWYVICDMWHVWEGNRLCDSLDVWEGDRWIDILDVSSIIYRSSIYLETVFISDTCITWHCSCIIVHVLMLMYLR